MPTWRYSKAMGETKLINLDVKRAGVGAPKMSRKTSSINSLVKESGLHKVACPLSFVLGNRTLLRCNAT